MGLRHRNALTDCTIFFVTTTVVSFLSIFADPAACNILIRNIKHYQERYKFSILAYVIMPSHFHWIVEVNKKYGTISDIMRDIKKQSAVEIMSYLTNEKYDLKMELYKNAAMCYDQKRKFWMKRFDDEVIRNEKMFWAKLRYIHNNPVKAGLVDKIYDYKYSSARNYYCRDNSLLIVDTEYADIEMPGKKGNNLFD
jgi:REP element-mobilizing transposase RayT